MNLTTVIGLLGGFALLMGSMFLTPTGLGMFLDFPSIIIVVLGSFAAMLVASPLETIKNVWTYFRLTLQVPEYNVQGTIRVLVEFSEKARKEGLLSLDDSLDRVEDNFLRSGMRLVVDGTDSQIIKSVLYSDINQMQERHEIGINFFDVWSKIAPAFGMIGTLIGLIALLGNLEDRSALGASMSVALVTTLYGAVLANLVFIPIKTKLEQRDKEEALMREIIIEGILSIQSGDNPRILEQKLLTYLPPSQRKELLGVDND